MAKKTVPLGKDQHACVICAQKHQSYLLDLLKRWRPDLFNGVEPDEPTPEPKKKKRKRKPKMNKNLFPITCLAALCFFAGTTIRCDVDDGDDKDKDKSAFVDVHGHDIQEAVSEALPGALVDFRDPDYECMAVGSIDREDDTDFDVLFVTACHNRR